MMRMLGLPALLGDFLATIRLRLKCQLGKWYLALDMKTEAFKLPYPHVAWLRYVVASTPSYRLGDNATYEGELDGFRASVCHNLAEFRPTKHFRSEAEARSALEPQLRAWELNAAMVHVPGVIEFTFRHSKIRERPLGPGELEGVVAMTFAGNLTAHVTIENVPPPPIGFAVDPMVRALASFYLLARKTPDVILHMAYAMTTCLEHHLGSLTDAAKVLRVSRPIFEKLNSLSSSRGEGAQVRKFIPRATPQPLTAGEREWVEQMIRLIVERAGASAAGAADLPEINFGTHPLK